MTELLTTSEAAEIAGCSRQSVHAAIKRGTLRAHEEVGPRAKREWRITRRDLAIWMRRRWPCGRKEGR